MKTVIFDLDGTILDTLQDLKNAVNHGLNFYNLPKKDLEFVRKAIGNGTTVLIQRCTPSSLSCEERNAVFNVFKTYYLEHYADYTKPYPGIKELLEKLYGKVHLADPYLINKIIKENNINKEDCLYVGDTNVDKESATNASLSYLLVNYGYRTKEELEKMCPEDTTISTVDELYNAILRWVNL